MTTTPKSGRAGWLIAMGFAGFGLATAIAMSGSGRPLAPAAPSPVVPDPGGAPGVAVVSQAPEDVLAYWTPERIAEADRNSASTERYPAEPAQPETSIPQTSTTAGPSAPENTGASVPENNTAPVSPSHTIPLAREQPDSAKDSATTTPSGPEVSAPGSKAINP